MVSWKKGLSRLVSGIMLVLVLIGIFSVPKQASVGCTSETKVSTNCVASYENVTAHEGDLIIDGTQIYVIQNCTYIQKGNISLKDYGKLVVNNAVLKINQTRLWECNFRTSDYSSLELEDALLASVFAIDFVFEGHSKVTFNRATLSMGEYFSRLFFRDSSTCDIQQCVFPGSHIFHLYDYSEGQFQNSSIGHVKTVASAHTKMSNSGIDILSLCFSTESIVNADGLRAGLF